MRILRWVIGTLLLVVFGAFTGIVWLAFNEDRSTTGEAPLIRADAEPYRQAPDKRGGLAVLNEGSAIVQALDRGPEPAIVEKILPAPQPAPKSTAEILPAQSTTEALPARKTVASEAVASGKAVDRPETIVARDAGDTDGQSGDAAGQAGNLRATDLPEALSSVEVALQADLPPLPVTQSRESRERQPALPQPTPRVITLSPSDLPVVDVLERPETTATAGAEEAAPQLRAAEPSAGEPSGGEKAEKAEEAPVVINPSVLPGAGPDTASEAEAVAPVAREPSASEPATVEPSAAPAAGDLVALLAESGKYRLQLAAFRTEEQARDAVGGLQGLLDTIVAGIDLRVIRAETDKGTFFRVQTAERVGRSGANALCEALKAAGGDCFVAASES